jgi:hypothetical protein
MKKTVAGRTGGQKSPTLPSNSPPIPLKYVMVKMINNCQQD